MAGFNLRRTPLYGYPGGLVPAWPETMPQPQMPVAPPAPPPVDPGPMQATPPLGGLPAPRGTGGGLGARFDARFPRVGQFRARNADMLSNVGMALLTTRPGDGAPVREAFYYGRQADQERAQKAEQEAGLNTALDAFYAGEEFMGLTPAEQQQVRAAFTANPEIAQEFLAQNVGRMLTPQAPDLVEVNGQLVDRNTRQVVGDYRTPPTPDYQGRVIPTTEYAAQGLPDPGPGRVWVLTEQGPQVRGAASPLVSFDQRAESAQGAALGAVLGKEVFGAMITEGIQAYQDIAVVDRLAGLLAQTGGGIAPTVTQIAGNFGIELGENVDEVQAANALINYLIPRQRPTGAGPTSNFDAQQYARALPRLILQPGANQIIIETMRGMLEQKIALADIAMRVALPEGDPQRLSNSEAFEMMRTLPDPFAPLKASPFAGEVFTDTPPAVGSAATAPAPVTAGPGNTTEDRLLGTPAAGGIPAPPPDVNAADWPAIWELMTEAQRDLFRQ